MGGMSAVCVCVTPYKYIYKDAPNDALNEDHLLTESYRFKKSIEKLVFSARRAGRTNFIVDSTTVDRQRRLLTTMVVVGGSTHGGASFRGL